MSPAFETQFHSYRLVSAMQLIADAKKPIPRTHLLAERRPSDISIGSVNSARCCRRSDRLRSILHLWLPGEHACCIGMQMRELRCVQFRARYRYILQSTRGPQGGANYPGVERSCQE